MGIWDKIVLNVANIFTKTFMLARKKILIGEWRLFFDLPEGYSTIDMLDKDLIPMGHY